MICHDTGFVLHLRPYRENSQLATVLTRDNGRFNLVGRGQRGRRGGPVLRPFAQLQFSWSGRGELKTLHSTEVCGRSIHLAGQQLYVGLYLNELMMRLLHEHEPHQELMAHYWHTLNTMADGEDLEPLLRRFELHLLEDLGYGLALDLDVERGEAVSPETFYQLLPGEGLRTSLRGEGADVFAGHHLLAMAEDDFSSREVLRAAKRLTRLALAPYLGSKPLASREFFRGVGGGTQ